MPISNPSLPTVPASLHVEGLTLDAAGLVITARTIAAEATCPVCGHASARVHGRRWRTFHDLPWQDRAFTWRVLARRFRCRRCPGHTFAEPVPGLPGAKARRTGVARNTLRRWLRAGEFVPYRRASAPGLLDPHLPFVEERWRAGPRNGVELHRELGARGFEGGYDIVRRRAAQRRRGQDAASRPPSSRVPSTRRTTQLLTGDPTSPSPDGRAFIGALLAPAPEIRVAVEHARAFADLMRRREPAAFDAWLDTATGLGGFVAGLRQDRDAVRAAVAEPWSNGPAEGHTNRLELAKRQMFGRAGFDLLRRRVLHAA